MTEREVRGGKTQQVGAEIIQAALESLFDPGPLTDAWKAEIDRRSGEIDAAAVELIENHEVFARVPARL